MCAPVDNAYPLLKENGYDTLYCGHFYGGNIINPERLKIIEETAMILPIYETARKYTGPTLILQGTHDRIVPYTYAERYHEDIKGSQLKLIEGDNHMFSNSIRQSCQFVANWMKTKLEGWKVVKVGQ